MQYLERTTLGELTGLDKPPHIRRMAEELLRLLTEGKTQEAYYPLPIVAKSTIASKPSS